MVFQGTVLGPALWNVFFSDVAFAAACGGGETAAFADDLNVFKKFPVGTSNAAIVADMNVTQQEVHRWGKRYRVTFDSAKEHIAIIHPDHGEGNDFRLLGSLIDVKLLMHVTIDELLCRVRPKVKSLVRTRRLYNHKDMLRLFKTHIWNYLEYHNGVIQHAAASQLERLEDLQRGFLEEIHLTEQVAFLDYNFAPLCLRRDIGLLGFLHKRVLGKCHIAIIRFFGFRPHGAPWHDKQLDSKMDECNRRPALYKRSMFHMVDVYNRLPQDVVDIDSVSAFQSCLTRIAKSRCEDGIRN